MLFNTNFSLASLPPESRLVFLCARTKISNETRDQICTLVGNSPDWNAVMRRAQCWGLAQLLYYQLHSICAESIPHNVLMLMQSNYQQNLARNLQLAAELQKILKRFEENHIAVVPFKGPVLAERLYHNLAFRKASSDLDLFVQRSQVAQARQLLLTLNFRQHYAHPGLSEEYYLRFKSHYIFSGTSTLQPMLELHWDIAPRYFSRWIKFEEKLLRCVRVPFLKTTAYSLTPEDLLQCLCIHLALHYGKSPFWVCDIAGLFSTFTDSQREIFMSRIRQERCLRLVLLGLTLAELFFEIEIPADFRAEMNKDTALQSFGLAQARKLIEIPQKEISQVRYLYSYPRYLWRLKDRFQDRIHLLTDRLSEMVISKRLVSTPQF